MGPFFNAPTLSRIDEAPVKKVRGGKSTYLDAELINSAAFRDLTQTAVLVYLDFRLRMRIHKKDKHSEP